MISKHFEAALQVHGMLTSGARLGGELAGRFQAQSWHSCSLHDVLSSSSGSYSITAFATRAMSVCSQAAGQLHGSVACTAQTQRLTHSHGRVAARCSTLGSESMLAPRSEQAHTLPGEALPACLLRWRAGALAAASICSSRVGAAASGTTAAAQPVAAASRERTPSLLGGARVSASTRTVHASGHQRHVAPAALGACAPWHPAALAVRSLHHSAASSASGGSDEAATAAAVKSGRVAAATTTDPARIRNFAVIGRYAGPAHAHVAHDIHAMMDALH